MKKNKKQKPPYISDDFQIGPYGAFEYSEDTINEMLDSDEIPNMNNYAVSKAIREYKKRLEKKAKKGHRKNGDG